MRVPCDKYQMLWVGADGTVQMCYVCYPLGNLHRQRLPEMLFSEAHKKAALGAFEVSCPNCHCSYDNRIQKHLVSRKQFRQRLIEIANNPAESCPERSPIPVDAIDPV